MAQAKSWSIRYQDLVSAHSCRRRFKSGQSTILIQDSHTSTAPFPILQAALQSISPGSGLENLHFQLAETACYFDSLEAAETPDLCGSQQQILLLPSRQIADAFLEIYFTKVHPILPILNDREFLMEYEAYWETMTLPPNGHAWMSCVHLLFAIGASYLLVSDAHWGLTEKDHLAYFMKSRACLEPFPALTSPTVHHVRASMLCTFYFIATCQINR